MKIIEWCWGLLGMGFLLLFAVPLIIISWVLAIIDDINLKEVK